jgi:uncharacterized SAM-binding protein YcdF (DUF218 family)
VIGAVVRLVAAGALAWGIGFVWFIVSLDQATPVSVATDAVVVLTGGPGRVARGAAVLDAGSARRMLVSGVGRGVTDAELAATVDAPRALFADKVDLGFAAIDTRSNAEETRDWMVRHRYRSLRLVTSAPHMKRARLELAARLPKTISILPDAVPVEPAAPSLAREFNKYALRWAALQLGVE